MSEFNLIVDDATPIHEIAPSSFQDHLLTPEIAKDVIEEEVAFFEQFIEDPDEIHDDKEYPRKGNDPGLVVIFNQETFDTVHQTRLGTCKDVSDLIRTFQGLGFNLSKENIHTDFTRREILNKLDRVSELDHSRRNSLIVIVLTHGDKNNALQAKDAPIYTNEIWEKFTSKKCKTLKDKPKFFIFQACKGESYSQHSSASVEIIPPNIFSTPLEPDMLVAFSAVEGARSYRNLIEGTWFIQEMCRNFLAYGQRDDVASLLIRTSKCVARSYYQVSTGDNDKEESGLIIKQMPLFVSTLTKRFYLNRSKDRKYLLHYKETNKKIKEMIQNTHEVMMNVRRSPSRSSRYKTT